MDDQRTDRESGGMNPALIQRGVLIPRSPAQQSWFRFSLKALLVLITLVAVGIVAYKAGQQNGYSAGQLHGSKTAEMEWESKYNTVQQQLRSSVLMQKQQIREMRQKALDKKKSE
jgi:hypothetical protein